MRELQETDEGSPSRRRGSVEATFLLTWQPLCECPLELRQEGSGFECARCGTPYARRRIVHRDLKPANIVQRDLTPQKAAAR